jgi:hypothetical protein
MMIASRSRASPSTPGATPPASELNLDNISASTNFSGRRTPRDSSERTARRRSSNRVEFSSPARDRGSAGFATSARSRLRLGASSRDEIDPSFTTNDPGVCSRHSITTPRLRKAGNSATIAARTAEIPPGLWLPRPVISSTSFARLTCRSRSHASARKRASAAVGNDSRRFRMFFGPNSASSKAFQTECRDTLPDRILKYMTVQLSLWCYGCLALRVYLHCAGAPAANPNAVVTTILQPSDVFTKIRSETPLEVVSFCVTV